MKISVLILLAFVCLAFGAPFSKVGKEETEVNKKDKIEENAPEALKLVEDTTEENPFKPGEDTAKEISENETSENQLVDTLPDDEEFDFNDEPNEESQDDDFVTLVGEDAEAGDKENANENPEEYPEEDISETPENVPEEDLAETPAETPKKIPAEKTKESNEAVEKAPAKSPREDKKETLDDDFSIILGENAEAVPKKDANEAEEELKADLEVDDTLETSKEVPEENPKESPMDSHAVTPKETPVETSIDQAPAEMPRENNDEALQEDIDEGPEEDTEMPDIFEENSENDSAEEPEDVTPN